MPKLNRFAFVSLFWTGLIAFLSLKSNLSFANEIQIANKDKYEHLLFYCILTVFWGLSFESKQNRTYLKIVLLVISYGILLEVCQGVFTETRQPDVFDALANSVGAGCGYLILKSFVK